MTRLADISKKARELHFKSLVIDGSTAAPMTAEHFERLRKGGVNAVNYTSAQVTDDFSSAVINLHKLLKTIDKYSDQVLWVRTSDDIKKARAAGKIGIIAGFQNAAPIMDKLEYLEIFYILGVRIMQLTYNPRNLIGDGCVESANGGLSRFGRWVVEEMNRLGMLVDVAHSGERTSLDAIEVSDSPVFITHSNARALCPSLRNKSDVVLRALAEKNGVIGTCFWAPMVYKDPKVRPGFPDYLDHIDYLVEHAGIDHVAVGSDIGEGESRVEYEAMFAGGAGIYPEVTRDLGDWYTFDQRMVEDLDTSVNFPLVTHGLLERGYSEADIKKIMGGNIMRIFKEVVG
jgi:membrane dipeptidase